MKHVYIVAVIFAVASPVAAFNLQNAQVASDLGQLIAAEEFCRKPAHSGGFRR